MVLFQALQSMVPSSLSPVERGRKSLFSVGCLPKNHPKKIDVASLMVDTSAKVVTLDKPEGLEVFDRATVNVKVVELKEIGGKSKTDIIIADGSGTARVSVWEGHVNTMEVNASYCLKNFMVREFLSTKYLTMAKEGSEIIAIGDIGGVVEQSKEDEGLLLIQNVSILCTWTLINRVFSARLACNVNNKKQPK